jgi:hypothetical protein
MGGKAEEGMVEDRRRWRAGLRRANPSSRRVERTASHTVCIGWPHGEKREGSLKIRWKKSKEKTRVNDI